MAKKASYRICEEDKLIVQYYTGDIFKDDIIQLQKDISNESNYHPTFDIIADFRDANLLLNENDVNDYVYFIKHTSKLFGERKSAYLTRKPNQVVLTTLFSHKIEDLAIHPRIFSTPVAVANWINKKHIDLPFISKIIDELKMSCAQ